MDTLRLALQKDQYRIIDPTLFTPTFRPYEKINEVTLHIFKKEHKGVRQFRQNPKSKLRADGTVYPNLTIYERVRDSRYSCDLHIQISLPKALFGESISEFTERNMADLIPLLCSRLRDMGVEISGASLRQARVTTAHYARNILWESEELMLDAIHKLSRCSMGQWYEGNHKTYPNDGYALRFHSKIFEMVFYHKYRDLLGTSTSIDPHKTAQEKHKAKLALGAKELPALMRYEVRINGSKSVKKKMLEAIGIDKDVWTFEELTRDLVSKKILCYYWDELRSKPENRLILKSVDYKTLVHNVLHEYRGYPPRPVAEAMGYYFMLHFLGVKHLRNHIIKRYNRQAWYRTVKKIVAFAKKYAQGSSRILDFMDKHILTEDIQNMLPLS